MVILLYTLLCFDVAMRAGRRCKKICLIHVLIMFLFNILFLFETEAIVSKGFGPKQQAIAHWQNESGAAFVGVKPMKQAQSESAHLGHQQQPRSQAINEHSHGFLELKVINNLNHVAVAFV